MEPDVGHEAFQGRLSIPYITKTGVVDLRFRSLHPAVEPKYMGMTGMETKMYNVLDIDRAGDWIGNYFHMVVSVVFHCFLNRIFIESVAIMGIN